MTTAKKSTGVVFAALILIPLIFFGWRALNPPIYPLPIDPVPHDPRFGIIEAYHEPDLADELGIGWERIIFYWSELEKDGRGDWNEFHAPFHRIDREIEGGREIVGLLAHTPSWATDGLTGAGIPYGFYLPIDDPDNLWATFVRNAVGTYAGRVDRWIIWNEPDIALDDYGAQWQGTTEDYYHLVKTAYVVAHEVNPDVQIHLGGLTYWHNPTYLREYLSIASQDPTAAENNYYFDVVSVHIYFKPETTRDIIGAMRIMLAEAGIEDKPIWINETNAPPYDDPQQTWNEPVFRVTQEMQADYLLQEFAVALAMDVERIAVYKWIDEPEVTQGFEPYGLLRTDRSPRPALDAYRTILTHYAATEDALIQDDDDLTTVLLDRGDQITRVFWARNPNPTIALIPAIGDVALRVETDGTSKPIRPLLGYYLLWLEPSPCGPDSECLMGGSPRLLIEPSSGDIADIAAPLALNLSYRVLAFVGGMLILLIGGVGGVILLRGREQQSPT